MADASTAASPASPEAPPLPSEAVLVAVEALAAELAREAGAETRAALGRAVDVSYKTGRKGKEDTGDPVSEVDRAVESLIRLRVGAAFPDHAILGEEV